MPKNTCFPGWATISPDGTAHFTAGTGFVPPLTIPSPDGTELFTAGSGLDPPETILSPKGTVQFTGGTGLEPPARILFPEMTIRFTKWTVPFPAASIDLLGAWSIVHGPDSTLDHGHHRFSESDYTLSKRDHSIDRSEITFRGQHCSFHGATVQRGLYKVWSVAQYLHPPSQKVHWDRGEEQPGPAKLYPKP